MASKLFSSSRQQCMSILLTLFNIDFEIVTLQTLNDETTSAKNCIATK